MLGYYGTAAGRVRAHIGVALIAVLLLAAAGGATSAQGKIEVIHGQRYGVLPQSAGSRAPSSLSVTGSPLTVGGPQPQLQYFGGNVMLTSKLYLIFWGPSGSFASTYSGPIVQWAKDLNADQAKITGEASVAEQYYQGSSPKQFITGHVAYGGALFDTTPYPALDTANGCTAAQAPCVSDAQIQKEIAKDIAARAWPTDPANAPVQQYLFFTPNGTSSCIDAAPNDCTFNDGYCAYHFQVTGLAGGHVATYSNLPYIPACNSGQAPAGTDGNADTDGTLDSAIHEVVESMTDPDGNEWFDSGGNEIADKCAWGFVSFANAYGTPLGGVQSAHTAFNQLTNTHTYFTQMMWSNQDPATPSSTSPAGCVARMGPSPVFNAPTAAQSTGKALTFAGTSSSEVLRPITARLWNYGDGSPTTSATNGVHTYYKAGTYTVSLRVADSTGSTNASTEQRTVTVTGSTLAPTITSFSPSSGIAGSTVVTINGTNLQGAAVKFGAVPAPTTSTTATQITVTVPNGAPVAKITVTTDGGAATSLTAFSPTLTVTSFAPTSGAPGTSVTIHGRGFNSSSAVSFHGVAASSVSHTSSTTMTATVPASATSGPITVTNSAAPVGHTRSATSFTVS